MPVATVQEHPVLSRFPCWAGEVPAGVKANFLGVQTREAYTTFLQQHTEPRHIATNYPPPCEDLLEYIDVLEAVLAARDQFIMIELGAGYGRWLVNAAAAARIANDIPCHFIGVEAEPTHFQWMRDHFRMNGLEPGQHRLLNAAVAPEDGDAQFVAGRAADWYAQALATDDFVDRLRASGDLDENSDDQLEVTTVPAISLKSLLREIKHPIDLLDIDIQGAELEVLDAARPLLNTHLRRVHIGTHGEVIERDLRAMFNGLGWQPVHDYGCLQRCETPWGSIDFEDGVQSWINPHLA